MTAKILVPIDFSSTTESIVAWASSLARDRKASLILLHVQEPIGERFAGEIYFPIPSQENADLNQALHNVVPADSQISYEHRLLLGAPPDQIVKLANEEASRTHCHRKSRARLARTDIDG